MAELKLVFVHQGAPSCVCSGSVCSAGSGTDFSVCPELCVSLVRKPGHLPGLPSVISSVLWPCHLFLGHRDTFHPGFLAFGQVATLMA